MAKMRTSRHGSVYPHMCRMDHIEIGHRDSSEERCPMCRMRDEYESQLADRDAEIERLNKRLWEDCPTCGGSKALADIAKKFGHRVDIAAVMLRDAEAEIERLRAQIDADNKRNLHIACDNLRLTRENQELRADLVWSVRKGVMVSHDENLRPCVWFDVHRGVECDGTPESICRAVRSAREERTDGVS